MQGLSRERQSQGGREASRLGGMGEEGDGSQVQSQPCLHHLVSVQNVKSNTEAHLSKKEGIKYL